MSIRTGGKLALVLTLLAVPMMVSAASADAGELSKFEAWSKVYDEINGDRDVVIRLAPSRFFATKKVETHGFVRLDLIEGKVAIELAKLDQAVDVWLLDNKPGPGKSIVPEDGDVVIHLGRLAPTKDGADVFFEKNLGPDAFRGVEVNWIYVSEAGADPAKSRLLYASRTSYENRYTRARLAREGFSEPLGAKLTPHSNGRSVDLESIMPLGKMGVISAAPIIARKPHRILVTKGLVPEKIFIGGDVFFHETFEGNGRSCGTCHPPQNNQTIDLPFMQGLPDSDPLFVAEQRPPYDPISQLERPELMRNFGLILENVDGLQDPNVTFVMRGVPHSLSMGTSVMPPPGVTREQVGWSADGAPAPGTLREFLLGAIIQHYPKNSLARVFKEDVPPGYPFDFRMPTDDELGLSELFSENTGRLNELTLANLSLYNANAEAGRTRFIGSGCNGCHNNASANVGPNAMGPNLNFLTNVEKLPNPAQGFMGINFPPDGGFGTMPNDCDMDGTIDPDCFGDLTFNSVGLIESADTPPFFHNNVVPTIEGAVQFYQGPPFAPAPGLGFTPLEVDQTGAFLRVINAAFNLQMSIQRNKAALTIDPETALVPDFVTFVGIRGTANRLLLLSNDEIRDAIEVLTGSPLGVLNPDSVELATKAGKLNREAISQTNLQKRLEVMELAVSYLRKANALLGTGIEYKLGSGNLLF